MALEFRDILVSHEVAAKLGSKHGVEVDEVAEVLDFHDLAARWCTNDAGIEYLLCRGATYAERRLVVVLYPAGPLDEHRWRLATAYPDPSA